MRGCWLCFAGHHRRRCGVAFLICSPLSSLRLGCERLRVPRAVSAPLRGLVRPSAAALRAQVGEGGKYKTTQLEFGALYLVRHAPRGQVQGGYCQGCGRWRSSEEEGASARAGTGWVRRWADAMRTAGGGRQHADGGTFCPPISSSAREAGG
jgi:hypothetical protein